MNRSRFAASRVAQRTLGGANGPVVAVGVVDVVGVLGVVGVVGVVADVLVLVVDVLVVVVVVEVDGVGVVASQSPRWPKPESLPLFPSPLSFPD